MRQQVAEQRPIPVRRFDEQLRLLPLLRLLFQGFDGRHAGRFLNGQIPVEGKLLPIQPRSHERQQQRRWPHQRHHAQVLPVRLPRQRRAGVGNAGAARFAQNAGINALLRQRREGGAHLRIGAVFVDNHETDILDNPVRGHAFHEAAGRAGIFHQKVGEGGHGGHHLRRQHLRGRIVGEGCGDEEERFQSSLDSASPSRERSEHPAVG